MISKASYGTRKGISTFFSFVNDRTDDEDFSLESATVSTVPAHDEYPRKASIILAQGKFADAIAEIERGHEAIMDFLQRSNFPELVSKSAEIAWFSTNGLRK